MAWAEAWALPHHGLVGYDGKKIAYLPTVDMSWGVHSDVWREEGAVSLPATFDRIDEIHVVDPDDHSNDEGSIIRLYDKDLVGLDGFPKPFFEFVVSRRSNPLTSKGGARVQFTGKGLTAHFLGRVVLKPYDYFLYDYPSDFKSLEDDWIYGGDSILQNGNMEEGVVLNEVQSVWIAPQELTPDPTPTFTLTLNGQTATLNYDDSNSEIEAAVNTAWTGVDEVQVTGTGSQEDPWEIEFLVPSGTTQSVITLNVSGLNQKEGAVARRQTGGTISAQSWEESRHTITGLPYGFYEVDGFRIVDSSVTAPHSGLTSLLINARAEPFNTPGGQQIVGVQEGHRHEAGVWIKTSDHTTTGLFRLVIRDPNSSGIADLFNETFIAKVEQLITSSNTWVYFPLSFFVPVGVHEVVFRVAWVGAGVGNPATFYIDDAFLAPGAPPATWGAIWLELMADAQTDHTAQGRAILTWLEPTYTALVDSAGNPWDAVRSITLTVDSTYDQIAEEGQNLWGYVHRIRFDETDGTYKLDIFNPGGGGVNRPAAGAGGSLVVGMNVIGGEMTQNYPLATHWRVTGGDNLWDEGRDTDLETAWGQLEASINEPDIRYDPISGFTDVINQQFTRTENQMLGFELETAEGLQGQPFVDFNVLDIVRVVPGTDTGIDAIDRYVTSIVGRADGSGRRTDQTHVSSDVFASSGAAAMAEGLRRLLRLRLRRAKKVKRNLPLSVRNREQGQGGQPTVVIAAFDATTYSKEKADFICTGVNDQILINEIIVELNGMGVNGKIQLTEGTYYIQVPAGTFAIDLLSGTDLEGMHGRTSLIASNTSDPGVGSSILQCRGNNTVRNLGIFADSGSTLIRCVKLRDVSDNTRLQNVDLYADQGAALWVDDRVTNWFLQDSYLQTVDVGQEPTIWVDGGSRDFWITNSYVVGGINNLLIQDDGVSAFTPGKFRIIGNFFWSAGEEAVLMDVGRNFPSYSHFADNFLFASGQNLGAYGDRGALTIIGDATITTGLTLTSLEPGLQVHGNVIEDANLLDGIRCIAAHGIILRGNYLEDYAGHGIVLEGTWDGLITENFIAWTAGANNTRDNIHIRDDSDRNFIHGNRMQSTQDLSGGNPVHRNRYGLNIDTTDCDDNIYVNNMASPAGGFGTAAYRNNGTGTILTWPGAAAPQGDNFET